MKAELIVTNGRVLTMDNAKPRAEAVALGGGRILAVGSRAEVEALADAETRVIDAGGRTVLPGFFESHVHLGIGGAQLGHLDLGGVHGMEALTAAFAAYSAANPDRPILMARSADYTIFDHPTTRHDLDQVLADRPIALMGIDLHTCWVNTAALKAAGLLHGREMPNGHEVVMGEDGLATGMLLEFEAFAPIMALAQEERINLGIATGAEPRVPPTPQERAIDKEHFRAGLRHCARHGITSMVMMDGNRYTLEILRELQEDGDLLARVKVPFHFKPTTDLAELDRAEEMNRDFHDDWLRSGHVKFFMDGVVDSRTAYMVEDYPDAPGYRGEMLFDPERFKEIATEVDRRGLQIVVHCCGDGAVHNVIDGYDAAQLANGPRDSRHRIEHVELIQRSDIPRMGALGIVASLQPPHPPGAMDFPLLPTLDRIAPARLRDAYLWKTLADNGAPVAFASDWPVADVSVLRGMKAALTRTSYAAGLPDERLGLMATLAAYTAGGAWAAHFDDVTGRLVPGLAADVVVIDGDFEQVAPESFDQLGIALTIAGGIITHQGQGFA